jgi:glutaredoxin
MNIVIYGKSNCSYCKLAERALQQKSIPYQYKSADAPEVVQHLIENVSPSIRSVPVVLVDGVYIGGYEELQNHIRNNLYEENGEYTNILKG